MWPHAGSLEPRVFRKLKCAHLPKPLCWSYHRPRNAMSQYDDDDSRVCNDTACIYTHNNRIRGYFYIILQALCLDYYPLFWKHVRFPPYPSNACDIMHGTSIKKGITVITVYSWNGEPIFFLRTGHPRGPKSIFWRRHQIEKVNIPIESSCFEDNETESRFRFQYPDRKLCHFEKKSGLIAGIDWHRLAPRKNAFFCRIKCTYAPINQPNISNCSSRQELSFELIGEKQLVELRAGG